MAIYTYFTSISEMRFHSIANLFLYNCTFSKIFVEKFCYLKKKLYFRTRFKSKNGTIKARMRGGAGAVA
jgi:hypothetical protein